VARMVLIVDSDLDFSQNLAFLLLRNEYVILQAINVQQAEALLDQYGLRIDLAIIDVAPNQRKSSKRNGLELIRKLIEEKVALKIMAVASGGDVVEQARAAGVDGVTIKPAEATALSDQGWVDTVVAQIGRALPDVSVRKEWLLERSRKLMEESQRLRSRQSGWPVSDS